MYQAAAVVQDYDASTDTCSVALTGIGIIDTWLAGIAIDAPINRAMLVAGQAATLFMPDAHKLCEAHIVALPGTPPPVTTTGGTTKTQTGRASIFNAASITITFPIPFTGAPTITTAGDKGTAIAVSSITTTSFVATVSAGPFFQWFTWSATGPV